MPYILFSLKVKGTTHELMMLFPVYSRIILQILHISQAELFNILRIIHKDFKNGCFFKGLGWSRPNFRDLKVPRPRQDRDFSYPRPRPGLRDPRPSKIGLKTETETETWSRDYNTGGSVWGVGVGERRGQS